MSTMIRADKTSFIKLTTLFKHLLALRFNNYKDQKAIQIIFTFHIFSEDYADTRLTDEMKKEVITNKQIVEKDSTTNINFMFHKNSFKLPLLFASNVNFILELTKLNPEVTGYNDDSYKYKIIFNQINNLEVEVKFVLQSDNSLVILKFIDKLISIPKLNNKTEILIERSFKDEIYLIDSINNEILLYKNENIINQRDYIQNLKLDPNLTEKDLTKFITLDFETIKYKIDEKSYENIPVLIAYFNFYNKTSGYELLFNLNDKSREGLNPELKIQKFLISFLNPKYHGFKFYAHNLSLFDGIFILKNLVSISNKINIKIEPLIRDKKLLSIKVRFGYIEKLKKYRYNIIFKDSLLLLLAPLSDLIRTLNTNDLSIKNYKDNSKDIINLLLSENAKDLIYNSNFQLNLIKYCLLDCRALALVIHQFSVEFFKLFKMNIHPYPTIASLSWAKFKTFDLKSNNLIPKISGKIYKDISKAYTGGHVDVYRLYSNKPVHSYDVISLYPNEMFNNEFPVGKVDYFKGNILSNKLNYTFEDLLKIKAFVKCDIFVDRSINRPVYQTHIKLNNQIRTMCATGTFLNQWIYIPELLKYQELTNNKIRIIENSIKEGYLFESKPIFKGYVETLFNLKNSSLKSEPLYMIAKILLNSLYGRFGLRQEIHVYDFIPNKNLEYFTKGLNINDIIKINDIYSLVISEKGIEDGLSLNSSVAIAAAVTSYARMYMAPLLLDESLDILYTDTDSFKSKNKITELERYKHLDHNSLGGLKYEETLIESIFLTPKVYGGISLDGNSSVKVKGFKNKVEFDILKSILFNNESIKLNQEKWFKDFINEEIRIKIQEYTLELNENKRNINLKTFETFPYHFERYDSEK
jgi:DNA polymerase type B, organellar and viral